MIEVFKKGVIDLSGLDLSPFGIKKKNIQIHNSTSNQIELYCYASDILNIWANKDKNLYICTNRDKKYSPMTVLNQNNVDWLFHKIISYKNNEFFEKTSPKCLLDLISENNLNKSEIIYIGDSKVDAEFASNANIDFLILDHNLHNGNLFRLIIHSFLD